MDEYTHTHTHTRSVWLSCRHFTTQFARFFESSSNRKIDAIDGKRNFARAKECFIKLPSWCTKSLYLCTATTWFVYKNIGIILLLNEPEPFSEWVSNIGHVEEGQRGVERPVERERERDRAGRLAERTAKAKEEREDRWKRPWKEETKRSYLTRFTFTASYFYPSPPPPTLLLRCSFFFPKFDVVLKICLEIYLHVEVSWIFAINLEIGLYITLIERNSYYEFSIRSLLLPFVSSLSSLLLSLKNIISKRCLEMEVSSLNVLRLFYRFK